MIYRVSGECFWINVVVKTRNALQEIYDEKEREKKSVVVAVVVVVVSQSLRVDDDYRLTDDNEDDPFASKFMSFEVSRYAFSSWVGHARPASFHRLL